MQIKCCNFERMADFIKQQRKRVILFGAGVIGTVTAPAILQKYGLIDNIECYIDNDHSLCGSHKLVYGKKIPVRHVYMLNNITADEFVVILNISRYASAIRQLNSYGHLAEMICFFLPMMCIQNFDIVAGMEDGAIKDFQEPVIPKVIHYMWLGKKEIPATLQKCIDTWTRCCPDYEIVQWNEDNYDVNKVPYMREAYSRGAYGFVPDYARLDILFQHGGFYLDTDVELLRSLDEMRYQSAFCGVEKWQVLNFGGCSGSVKGNAVIGEFLKNRQNINYLNQDGSENRTTCGFYDTVLAMRHGYKINGTVQKIGDLNIYTSDYFHPYDYMSGRINITANTFSIHHFNGGWLSEELAEENKKACQEFEKLYESAIDMDI